VGVRAISPPFSFLAMKDGQQGVRGYSVEEWTIIGNLIGADIKFVIVENLDDFSKMLTRNELDFIAQSTRPSYNSGMYFIPMGYSLRHHLYVNSGGISFSCITELDDKQIVIIDGAPYSPEIQLSDNNIKVTSPLEALSMLNQGVVEAFIAPSERVADYLVNQYALDNVIKKGRVLGEIPLGILLPPGKKRVARNLQKAVRHLQETGVLAQLRNKWFIKPGSGNDLEHYAKHIAITAAAIGSIFIFVVLWNVSLKRRVDQAAQDLRQTEQRYRDLIESSPDMIFLVNETGDILHANERARTFLHVPDDLASANIGHLMAEDDVDEIQAFLNKVFNDGCDKHDFVMQGRSGHPMEVEVAGRIIQEPLHTEILACLFARNVTERNCMEKDLIQSERLGIIGRMAASVAHEINNPLGTIRANAEVLLFSDDWSEETREGLLAIQRNAIRAGEITTGLLKSASPQPISVQTLDVEDLVSESISLLGPKAKNRNIVINIKNGPLYIRGDSRALQQVLVNLLFNALAYTDEKGTIMVTGNRNPEDDQKTVRLVVSDTGKGIAQENLSRIFEPFFTSRQGGFGLGLFFTRRMVERHDGIIFAESEVGKGTAIFLEFPSHDPKEA
jgi:PAS domain S-box-containing protein